MRKQGGSDTRDNHDDEPKDSKKTNTNIWNDMLNKVTSRDGQKDSYLILLGDKGSGKRSLIQQINAKHVLGSNRAIPVD